MKLKNIGIYAAIVAFFIVLAYAFVPEVLSGKIVNQNDISGWKGMAQETIEWNKAHPDNKTQWSDSMFGGMPNVTSMDAFEGDWTKPLYKALLWGKRPASYLFIALLGAFLMMLAMGVNKFLSVIGAVAVAFCAYNFQIIQVGHNTKMQAIAFAPWAIAAFVWTYRRALSGGVGKKWIPSALLGSALFGLAISMQIKANHVQITYYLAIILIVYAIATLIWCLRKENRPHLVNFLVASALLLVFGVVGIGTNANKLIPTADYAKYTMRGGSELSGKDVNENGLSLDYATAWSYGIEETPNLLIPNYNGGSSDGSLGRNTAMWQLFKKAGANPSQVCAHLPLYWGPQPFTAGPMYIGAISIFLFVLGLFLCKGREKWWLAVCTVLAILLAWGNHFMWFTEFWFKYAPMYSKFRTVSMALVTLQFCVPLLGIFVLDRIMKNEYPHREVVKATWWSVGITAGFCLVSALIPSLAGDFVAPSDSGMQEIVANALCIDREHLLQADAWRSFLLILVCGGVLIWSYYKTNPATVSKRLCIAAVVIGALTLFDLWSVGKRYLKSSDFITPRSFNAAFEERPVDKEILKDKSVSYRVLDLSESTFNSSLTSYRHKSIGGYSPTKMQRYQDLIEHYIVKEINRIYKEKTIPYLPVLSMLNSKYIIIDPSSVPLQNPYAFGPAWFVSSVVSAASADEEIEALGKMDLHTQAVLREEDVQKCNEFARDSSAFIGLESYAPNELHYLYRSDKPSIAVFSEIFHPSWKATLVKEDGTVEPLELMRANWVLRAAALPEGIGEIVMRYQPQDYVTGKRISLVCSILLLLMVLSVTGYCVFAARRKE